MRPPPAAPGESSSASLALANTLVVSRGQTVDLVADAPSAAAWLVQRALTVRAVSAADVAALQRLRGAVRDAFAACVEAGSPTAASLRIINRAAAEVSPPRLSWAEGRPHTDPAGALRFPAALALLAADAIALLTGERADRLRRCEARGCIRFFLQDHGRRRWCSRACGDRVRVARHYERRHRPAG